MGLEKPKAIGELQSRGMAVFEDDHELGEIWRTYLGTGVRISFVPMTPTKVYWFVVWADYSELGEFPSSHDGDFAMYNDCPSRSPHCQVIFPSLASMQNANLGTWSTWSICVS